MVIQKKENKKISKNSRVQSSSPTASQEIGQESSERIRIKIKAYDSKIIDQSVQTILEASERTGAKIAGPVPLPVEKKLVTVNRSTFVHKDARDQYEMRVHKRLIDILSPTPSTIEALTNLNLPAGVDVEIKM